MFLSAHKHELYILQLGMKGQRAVLVKGLKAFRSRLKWDFPEIRQFKVIEVKSKLEIFPFL